GWSASTARSGGPSRRTAIRSRRAPRSGSPTCEVRGWPSPPWMRSHQRPAARGERTERPPGPNRQGAPHVTGPAIALAIIAIVIVIYVVQGVRIVRPYQRGIVEQLGKYK